MDDVEVWPDNWAAFRLLRDVQTQWRVGVGGPTGLDYPSVFALMEFRGIPPDERGPLFDDLQVMEVAAIGAMSKRF
ncbi:MAG: hypothetical protein EPO09_20770 [Aquabacterium sp.]|nr:MAG: hypothetical protein EPO09_20770 [Aquabacterium sp.]